LSEFAYALAPLSAGHLVSFDAVLTVPDAPVNNPPNPFYYWIGFEDAANSLVIQPMLIWNVGQHVWQVQDNVYPIFPGSAPGLGNNTTVDQAVTVHPGDKLTMQLSEVAPNTYKAIFPGLTGGLTVVLPSPMVHAVVAAETALADPNALPQGVTFSDMHLMVKYATDQVYDAPVAWNGVSNMPGVDIVIPNAYTNVIGIHTTADHGLV